MKLEMTGMTVSASVELTVQVESYHPLKLSDSIERHFEVELSPDDNEETIREAMRIETAKLYNDCWAVTQEKMAEYVAELRGETTPSKKESVEVTVSDEWNWE